MKNIGNIKNKNIDALLNSKNIYYEGGGKTLNNIIYPIGSVVIRVDSQNPSYWYGGTWELLCPGRTMVCVDTSDTDFNTVKKTGGEKTHTLTIDELAKHNHVEQYVGVNWFQAGNSGDWCISSALSPYRYTAYTGGDKPHNNLQPYMTVYIWVRTK